MTQKPTLPNEPFSTSSTSSSASTPGSTGFGSSVSSPSSTSPSSPPTSSTTSTTRGGPQASSGGLQSGQGSSGASNQSVVEQAKGVAGNVAHQARDQVSSQVSAQKDRAAGSLGTVAHALRQTGQQLRGQEPQGPIPQYIDKAADQVERISGYLQSSDMGQMVGEVEHFARREPVLFVGGAFVLGLLGARFLKSSSHHHQHPQDGVSPYGSSYGSSRSPRALLPAHTQQPHSQTLHGGYQASSPYSAGASTGSPKDPSQYGYSGTSGAGTRPVGSTSGAGTRPVGGTGTV